MTKRKHKFRVGDRATSVYPQGRHLGTVVELDGGLGFEADHEKPPKVSWTMPIDEYGRCTHSTHTHVYLAPPEERDKPDYRYTRAVAVWLARKTGVDDPGRIKDVTFEHEEGYAYSEYTIEPGQAVIAYRLARPVKPDRKRPPYYDDKVYYINSLLPADLVREVLEILEDPEAQRYLK